MSEPANKYFVMTVDVDPPPPSAPNLNLEKGVHKLLQIFKRYKIKSTFFVTATMSERFPDLMHDIIEEGHEIACHDLDHSPKAQKLGAIDQTRRLKAATELIEKTAGVRPVGYRAPLFKISRNHWVALQKNNYLYDSSVICSPFFSFHEKFFPLKPFLISSNKNNYLLEIPVSVNPILMLPIGGTYFRVFGKKWAKFGIKSTLLCNFPIVFYIHPKDILNRYNGPNWHSYKNTSICAELLKEVLCYVKSNKAVFIKAIDLANLFVELM